MKTLLEILPDPLINDELGLFSIIREQGDLLSWISEEDAKRLDVEYLYSHSGDKTASPLLRKLIERGIVKDTVDSDENEISWVDVLGTAAKMIYGRFAYNWNKIHDAYITEYKPLENYSMEEIEARSLSHEGEDSDTSSQTGEGSSSGKESSTIGDSSTESDSSSSTENDSDSSTEKATDAKSGTSSTKTASKITTQADNQNSLYGFNSSDAVPSDASNGNSTVSGSADDNRVDVETSDSDSSEKTLESSGTKTLSSSGTKTITSSESASGESSSSSKSASSSERSGKNSYDDDENRTLTRRGNIGVTTSQQMLESELELRKYDLIERMFSDCDRLLTTSVYG